jgi:hypothetical protein
MCGSESHDEKPSGMNFSLFINETASLTYSNNNNTPQPQASGNGTCDQFYGVFTSLLITKHGEQQLETHFHTRELK